MTMQETTTETTTTKSKIAEHEYLGADGSVVDDEESAQGYRYTLLSIGDSFDWQVAAANTDELRLLALFGAKTLATNEISQVRNNKKNISVKDTPEIAKEALEAVRKRFELIRDGQWVDRTREGGVGARVNRDSLTEALCQVLVAGGKKTQADIDNGYKAMLRQRMEDDAEWLGKVRKQPDVAAAYVKIVGAKDGKTVDDLIAGL
jgi:hypothetical protein